MGDKQSAVAEKNSSNGSDSAPSWLKDLGVKSGEWYISAKARPKRLMKTALSTEAGQIQHCLELHTMPYQSELAVKMLKGKVVPLTPADICEETGYSKQHVRRGLKELEEHGVARRRPINGRGLAELQQDRTEKPVDEKDLTKANVAIYSWAVPRKDTVENGSRARLPFWDSLEPEFAPLEAFASRWKIIPEDNIVVARESLSEAMVAVAEAEEAQKVAVAIVKGILAPSRIYKEERNGKELERNPPPAVQPVLAPPVEEEPAGRSVLAPENGSIKAALQKHLEKFRIPRLTPETVREIAKHIRSPQALDAYIEATKPERLKTEPRGWGLLIKIAKEVNSDGERYAQAQGNGHSPPGKPLTAAEQRKQAYLRKFQTEASS